MSWFAADAVSLEEAIRLGVGGVDRRSFHGRRGEPRFAPGRPAFFTGDREMATFYAEADLSDGDPMVWCFTFSIRQPAGLGDLLSAAGAAGATVADIRRHSRFLGMNPNDFVYVPAVRDELVRRGCDGFIGLDFIPGRFGEPRFNPAVPVAVVFDPALILLR